MHVAHILLVFYFLYSGIICYEDDEDLPVIEISTGLLKAGYRELSHLGTTYTAFEGIPYARPPVGELRFQAPREPYNWTGIWIANTKYSCIPFAQTAHYMSMPSGEDCLYLNVYVPSPNPTAEDKFDVVVHFHSGGFTIGHPHFAAGPKYLMDEEHMIYVTLSYRLGPLGFLSTEDEIIPGNNGLKDQVMALRWIQKNIKYFGGNPNSVTIHGLSSGGASIHYHYLSPMSKGLFHKGISSGGTALDPWALQDSPLIKAKRLAVLLGCHPTTSQDILNCMMQRSSQAIFVAAQKFYSLGMPFTPFGPVVEPKYSGAFLDEHPLKKLTDGPIYDVPWIVIINKDEGLFPAGLYYNHIAKINHDWNMFAPHLLDYNYTTANDKMDEVSTKIRQYYFGDQPVSFQKLVKVCSDRYFFRGAEKSALLQQKQNKSPVYALMFAYVGDHSYSGLFGVPVADRGVAHGDDTLFYLSGNMVYSMTENDGKIKDIMVKMIANLAKNNTPNIQGIEWKPLNGDKFDYLYLGGIKNLGMREGQDIGSDSFWKALGLKENENYFFMVKDEL